MENNTQNDVKVVEKEVDEKDIILEKALDEVWERGFKYGVAWILQQTVENEDDQERITELLKAFEEEDMLKGITPIYFSLQD